MADQLGVNKTYQRALNHFHWPGIKKDVRQFCKSCQECQVVGKPNQGIPVALLKPIPAAEELFSKVIVDCVGPLPRTKAGNQYLPTIMCASTRFPEVIPLRNIKAKRIVSARSGGIIPRLRVVSTRLKLLDTQQMHDLLKQARHKV